MFKGKLQRACADRFHRLRDKLHLSALLVNTDAAADQHVQAVFRPKSEKNCLTPEENDWQLRLGVLQREINVARWSGAVIGNLALHPNVAVFLLHELAHLRNQVVHGPDAARGARLFKAEAQLRRLVVF